MGWRSGEVWFDADVLWFREQPGSLGSLAVSGGAIELPRFDTGLGASRRRRFAAESERKRRFAARTAPAIAVVVGSSVVLPVSALRQRGGAQDALPLPEDPPSLTFGLESPLQLRDRDPSRGRTRARRIRLASPGARPRRTDCRTPVICTMPRSSRLRVPTGSRGTRTPTPAPTCPGGSTATSARSGRSSRCSPLTDRRIQRPRWSSSATSASVTAGSWISTSRTRTGSTSTSTTRAATVAAGTDFHGTDRSPPLAAPARRLRRSGREQDLRRLRDRPTRTARSRHSVPEPRVPHARPLPEPELRARRGSSGGTRCALGEAPATASLPART